MCPVCVGSGRGKFERKSARRHYEGNQIVPKWEECAKNRAAVGNTQKRCATLWQRAGISSQLSMKVKRPTRPKSGRMGHPGVNIFLEVHGLGHPPCCVGNNPTNPQGRDMWAAGGLGHPPIRVGPAGR